MTIKVLIVDDSKLARMAVAKLLNGLHPDWKRLEAGTADDALSVVKTEGADIVLLDFNMPGRDGLELAAELRNLLPDLPVALVSANHQQEVVTRAQAIGAVFLPKPLNEGALAGFLADAAQRVKAGAS